MTVDPPRRLRPRAPQRRNTVDKTKGAPSAKGTTAAARPVTTGHRAQQYVPPTVRIGFDRLTAYVNIPAASLTGTNFDVTAWDGTYDVVGTSAALNSPDDGGVYLFAEGVYAVTANLRVDLTGAAASSAVIHLALNSGEINGTPEAIWHGANDVSGFTSLPNSTVVQYAPGHGLSGGLFAVVFYPSIDAAVTNVLVMVSVTRVR